MSRPKADSKVISFKKHHPRQSALLLLYTFQIIAVILAFIKDFLSGHHPRLYPEPSYVFEYLRNFQNLGGVIGAPTKSLQFFLKLVIIFRR